MTPSPRTGSDGDRGIVRAPFVVGLAVLVLFVSFAGLGWYADSRLAWSDHLDDGGLQLLAHAAAMTTLTLLALVASRQLVAAGAALEAWVLSLALFAGPVSIALATSLLVPAGTEYVQVHPKAPALVVGAVVATLSVVAASVWQRRRPAAATSLGVPARVAVLGAVLLAGYAATGPWDDPFGGDNQLWADAGHGPIPANFAAGWTAAALLLATAAFVSRRRAALSILALAAAVPPVMLVAYANPGGYPEAPGYYEGILYSTIGFALLFVLLPLLGALGGAAARRLHRGAPSAGVHRTSASPA